MKSEDEGKKAVKDKIVRVAILCLDYQQDWIVCISISLMGLVWAVLAAGSGGEILLDARGGCTHTDVLLGAQGRMCTYKHTCTAWAHLGGGRLWCPS